MTSPIDTAYVFFDRDGNRVATVCRFCEQNFAVDNIDIIDDVEIRVPTKTTRCFICNAPIAGYDRTPRLKEM